MSRIILKLFHIIFINIGQGVQRHMRKITTFFIIIVMAVFVLPIGLSAVSSLTAKRAESVSYKDAVTAGNFSQPFEISVYNTETGKTENVEFESYITGVLAGEMPPSYNIEALKAQAVAARSFILSKAEDYFEGKNAESHHGAMICTDPNHCKSWRDIKAAKKTWDVRYADDYENKIKTAVSLTCGEYMTYDNKVVKAYFYAMSSGRTENVEDVWGVSLPYLKSVSSKEDIGSDGFESRLTLDKDAFVQKLKEANGGVEISDTKNMICDVKRTEGGGVSKIKIGNTEFEGSEIRKIFNLRSTNFTIECSDGKVTFEVYGYGHGVGMSQNGANVLAEKGLKYREILKHYYTGVSIVNLYKKF